MNSTNPIDPDVKEMLERRYPSYQEPLKKVWAWNRDGTSESWKKAEAVARGLIERKYSHALQLHYELAFSLVRQKRRSEALHVLRQAERKFPTLDEDSYCLMGRCPKEDGDELDDKALLADAELAYKEAQQAYEKAYNLRQDRFPWINLIMLQLVRAGLLAQIAQTEQERMTQLRQQAADLREASRTGAIALLAQRETWVERLSDDRIWMRATAADACLIKGDWDAAAENYRRALDKANEPKPHHFTSMKVQVVRLNRAFDRLGIKPQGPLADPEAFFAELEHAALPTM